MTGAIGNFFVKVDNFCDYLPYVSTVTNLFDLFSKYVFLPVLEESNIINISYSIHLKEKSLSRCVLLLFPFLGNVSVGIYDLIHMKYYDKNFMLAAVLQNGLMLKYASRELKKDKE